MRHFSLSHLDDGVLARDLKAVDARDREATAVWLAHIAEFDARRLYAQAGYPSEQLLAERFPRADVPTRLVPLVAVPVPPQPAAALPAAPPAEMARNVQDVSREHSLANVPISLDDVTVATPAVPTCEPEPARVQLPRPRVTPLSAGHWALQATLSRIGREALQEVLDLLGHKLAPGDIDGALERALSDVRRSAQEAEVRGDLPPGAQPPAARGLTARAGGGEASGVGARWWPLHVRE